MPTLMRVSPQIYSEIQSKAAEQPFDDLVGFEFAEYARKRFGLEAIHSPVKVVVVWEWGTQNKWDFPKESR